MVNEIFNDPLNFDQNDGLVKDSVLISYGITCPNMCSTRGSCEKSYFLKKETYWKFNLFTVSLNLIKKFKR